MKRKIVLGIGNLLFSDEGFGVHALRILEGERGSRFPVEWVDGGVLGLNLLPLVEECSHLLVLDAIDATKSPGSLVEISGNDLPLYAGVKMSEHQVGFQEVLAVAKFRGNYPGQLSLIGVQPADLSVGTDLSQAVAAAMPSAIARAVVILESWFPASQQLYQR